MRIPLCVLGFGFVLSVAGLTAQSTQQPQTTTPPVNPSTPATRIGDGGQSKAGTPVPSSTAPSTTGGVAGAASSSTAQTPENQESAGGVSAMTDSDLETQIENALSKEPTLTGASPRVKVAGDTVELNGTVGTNKEKITATRIVQSYAGSKRLVNRLTIGKGGEKAPPHALPTDKADRVRQPGTATPANNLEPDKSSPPSTSTPP